MIKFAKNIVRGLNGGVMTPFVVFLFKLTFYRVVCVGNLVLNIDINY